MTAKMTQPDQNARAFWWLAGLFALLSGIFLLCLATGLGGRGVTELTDDIGELFAPVVAAAFCGLASSMTVTHWPSVEPLGGTWRR